MMRGTKEGKNSISTLEATIYARRTAGASLKDIARESGLSATYVSKVYRSARRKLEAKALMEAHPRRIDFIN